VKLEYRNPTTDDILTVARNMRAADVHEVAAAGGRTPLQALVDSVQESDASFVACLDGEPVCIFGCSQESETRGVVWLLGTDAMVKNLRLFAPESRRLLDEWADCFGTIYNYVDASNMVALRWLTRMGFKPLLQLPYGPAKLPFFLMERDGDV